MNAHHCSPLRGSNWQGLRLNPTSTSENQNVSWNIGRPNWSNFLINAHSAVWEFDQFPRPYSVGNTFAINQTSWCVIQLILFHGQAITIESGNWSWFISFAHASLYATEIVAENSSRLQPSINWHAHFATFVFCCSSLTIHWHLFRTRTRAAEFIVKSSYHYTTAAQWVMSCVSEGIDSLTSRGESYYSERWWTRVSNRRPSDPRAETLTKQPPARFK